MSVVKEADPILLSKISNAFSFSFVFWIDASSIGTITQGLKGICNLPAAQSSGLDGSPESALHWLGSLKQKYIMVFDNVSVLAPAELEAYLPPGGGGNILITSCNYMMRDLTLLENSLEVTELDENDAIELLLKASCLDPLSMEFQAEAAKIVKELFFLPLAIDQAGAHIASGATTIKDYLAKYSEHQKTSLFHSEFTGASKYKRAVYETLELSHKEIQLRAESKDSHKANAANNAMLLLELFPFFHHEGITEEIFSYAALHKDQNTSDSKLPLLSSTLDQKLLPLNNEGAWDNLPFREGIQVLLSSSFIKKSPSDGVYAMHPLVHAWGRDRMTLDERERCCLMAYTTLCAALKKDASQPYEFQRILLTHIRANREISRSESYESGVSYLDDDYDEFGMLSQEQGYFKETETLDIEVQDTRKRILEAEHPDTIEAIKAMEELAITYHSQEKYTEAEKLAIQVLNARIRSLGVEHSHTIIGMANLGEIYNRLGKHTEAEKLEIQVLDARKRLLGITHPATHTAMERLAATYDCQGNYTDAEKLKTQVLDVRSRIHGVEHLDTIMAMENLASSYGKLGRHNEAEKLESHVLISRTRILGMEDPGTLRAMGNLANTYHHLKKFTEAEKLESQVLNAKKRILGVEDPESVRAMTNLAATYLRLGKYTEAEKLGIQTLDASNKILGAKHPDTITAMANLGVMYDQLGKLTDAEKLLVQVLNARNSILGLKHPETIRAMTNLAILYRKLGKYTEAEKLEIQILDGGNRTLEVKNPKTIIAMKNPTGTSDHLERYTDSGKSSSQVLDSKIDISGPEHPVAIANDTETDVLQSKVTNKLQVHNLDGEIEVVETEDLLLTGAITNLVPKGKQLVLAAKTALQHLQQYETEIKTVLSHSRIYKKDYALLAGFNESKIHSGLGYMEEIHVLLWKKCKPKKALLHSLGKIFSPFPGMIFTTCPPDSFQTPVFNTEGKPQAQALTYTTLKIGNLMKEKEEMLAKICLSEGKGLSGSGSGGGGNEKKPGENVSQVKRVGGSSQKGGKKNSEWGDPNDPYSRDDSDTHLSQISFNIQTEIHPYASPVPASGPSSSKPSKHFQLIQLEGNMTVQVGISS